MALTRDYKDTVIARIERDPSFAKALLSEAASLFLNGEAATARILLRDLVNSTIGFENLAEISKKPSKSLHRMLSKQGNPSMENLAIILSAICNSLNISFEISTISHQADHILPETKNDLTSN